MVKSQRNKIELVTRPDGHQSDMYEALHEGIRTIEIDNWLQVIPQLIARIDTPRPLVVRLIHQLLADLGRHHPQVLPLTKFYLVCLFVKKHLSFIMETLLSSVPPSNSLVSVLDP